MAKKNEVRIKPLADRVLIKESADTVEQNRSGIIIPISIKEDKGAKSGEVVAVGSGRTEDGKKIAPEVAVGDHVLFSWGDKVKVGDDEYYIVRESEIIAVIK